MKTKTATAAATKTATLTNSYHGSRCRVRVPYVWSETMTQREILDAIERAAHDKPASHPYRRRLHRVRRMLCGIDGCTCGVVR